jgi:hypothetical protein
MPTVVISPYNVAAFPEGGGHWWVYMQYVQGLRQLGCEVYWLEGFRTQGDEAKDAAVLSTFRARMERYGLGGKCILYPIELNDTTIEAPRRYLDMTQSQAEAIFKRADLLANFHYSIRPGLLACFRRTALIDIDPGLLQFWISREQLTVPRHDFYFTISENVGKSGGKIADCGLNWNHIRPAVSLRCWPYHFDPGSEAFTTVSIWDSDDWIVDKEEVYENTKRVAFFEFAELPALTRQPLELALFLRTERDMAEWNELVRRGWRIRQSSEVAATPEQYRAHIQRSRGEFSCAKPSYVKLQTAWVSDRTVCYLASGKPVVVQDTGPSSFLPSGEGMFRFRTVQEAAQAFEVINANYEHHCRAARNLAETYFDARQGVGRILEAIS